LVLGGVGLFLLGMSVRTIGLKALGGSGLRTNAEEGGSDSVVGRVLGCLVTHVQRRWRPSAQRELCRLIALIGVRLSLTAAALPMIFVGALIKLLGRGHLSAAGAAFAGFAHALFEMTDTAAGDEWTGRTVTPSGPSRCF
jgi:phosphate:Na+ symporter